MRADRSSHEPLPSVARHALIALVILAGARLLSWPAQAAQVPPGGPGSAGPAVRTTVPDNATLSRVNYFRELMLMPAAQRENALAEIPEPKRRVLLGKIHEYERLSRPEREHRLRLVELWGFLVPLMKMPPENRGTMLSMIPEGDRGFIQERLAQWDQLPAQFKADVLENKQAILYFLRLQASSPAEREEILASLSEPSRRALEQEWDKWQSLPAKDRERMCEHFRQFFDLPDREKEKTLKALDTLSEEERLKMQAALDHYEKLPPDQRQMCINSFEKLARMSKEERAQFLRKAERWAAMTPRERETWRSLVTLLPAPQPPLPGEIGRTAAPKGTNYPPNAKPRLPGQ